MKRAVRGVKVKEIGFGFGEVVNNQLVLVFPFTTRAQHVLDNLPCVPYVLGDYPEICEILDRAADRYQVSADRYIDECPNMLRSA